MKPAHLICCVALVLGTAPVLAAPALSAPYDLAHPAAWKLSPAALDLLVRAARLQNPQASRADVIAAATEDHLLGQFAAAHYGDDRLFDGQRVGRSIAASAETSLVATVERVEAAVLKEALSNDAMAQRVVQRHELSAQRLGELLGVGRVRGDDSLTPAQRRTLDAVPLLDARLHDGTPLRVTLGDVWRRLEVHGRSALYRLDVAFAHRQAMAVLRASYVHHWAIHHTALQEGDWQQLLQLMTDRERRVALQRVMGASPDMHGGDSELVALRREVTAADIARFYAAHPERFERVDRVLARQIRCANEATAAAAYAELQAGMPFEAAARACAIDALPVGGSPSWVDRPGAVVSSVRGWAAQVAFAQPPGPPSRPIREPESLADAAAQPAWLIVQVQERQASRHALGSESARFIATEAIARQRAVDNYLALRDRLLRGASAGL